MHVIFGDLKHKSILYTIEKSKNTLQFIDVDIQISDNGESEDDL